MDKVPRWYPEILIVLVAAVIALALPIVVFIAYS